MKFSKVPQMWFWVAGGVMGGLAVATLIRRAPTAVVQAASAPVTMPSAVAAEQSAAYESAALRARQRPGDPDLALQAGVFAGNSGQYREGLKWFRTAARLDPKRLEAITGQGQMWMELGRPGMAAEEYERARRLAPSEPHLLLELARAYTLLRDFDPALQDAQAAQKQLPQDPEVYRALASIYAELLDRASSLRAATRACELAPGDVENWALKGTLLLRQNSYPEAEAALKRALACNPAHVAANLLYARTLLEGRKTAAADREAFGILSRVRLMEPRNAQALLFQGQILVRAGQLPMGVGLLREAREASPRDPQILLALGQALIRSGQAERGVQLVNASQQLGPRSVAFMDLENLVHKNNSPALAERLASLYQRQELYDSAIRVLERALKSNPDQPRLRAKLAEVRQEVDRRSGGAS